MLDEEMQLQKSEEELVSAVDALGGFDRGLYAEKWGTWN